jgi:hypothetical protein
MPGLDSYLGACLPQRCKGMSHHYCNQHHHQRRFKRGRSKSCQLVQQAPKLHPQTCILLRVIAPEAAADAKSQGPYTSNTRHTAKERDTRPPHRAPHKQAQTTIASPKISVLMHPMCQHMLSGSHTCGHTSTGPGHWQQGQNLRQSLQASTAWSKQRALQP